MAITPGSQFSNEIATTAILDADVIYSIDVTSPEFKEVLVRLGIFINDMVHGLNKKETAFYPLQEYACSIRIFPNPALSASSPASQQDRPVFRTTIDFGTLPNNVSKSVPHNITITPGVTFTRIYGTASDTTGFNYIPLPYASASGDNIELAVNATDVVITTQSDRTNFTITYVVLEYVQT